MSTRNESEPTIEEIRAFMESQFVTPYDSTIAANFRGWPMSKGIKVEEE